MVTAEEIRDLLFDKKNGFLIKYHFKDGLDIYQLDRLYEILESLKADWKHKMEVPKQILYYLVTITPVLYRDLQLYSPDQIQNFRYVELIDNLDTSIQMCLNPDINDVSFNEPLKDLSL